MKKKQNTTLVKEEILEKQTKSKVLENNKGSRKLLQDFEKFKGSRKFKISKKNKKISKIKDFEKK